MIGLPLATWERLVVWLVVGMVVYVFYARRHSFTARASPSLAD